MHGGNREMWQSQGVTSFLAFLPLHACDLSSPIPSLKRLLVASVFYLGPCTGVLTGDVTLT